MRILLFLLMTLAACGPRAAPIEDAPPKKDDAPPKKDDTPPRKDKEKDKDEKPPKAFTAVDDLNAEIAALQVLYSLNATKGQIEALAKAAEKTMQDAPPVREIKVSEKYRKTLLALRDAFAKGDDEGIDTHFKALDEIREKEEVEFDGIDITAEARKQAPALLRLFGPRQVTHYLLGVTEFPDPVERLIGALEETRELRGDAWAAARDDAAAQAAWLIAGLDDKAEAALKVKMTAFLDGAQRLDDGEFKKQRPALIREARGFLGTLGPTDIIRHYMERVLAETLSNHRLKASLAMMGKR